MAFNNEGFGGTGQVKNSVENALIRLYAKKLDNSTGSPSLTVKLIQSRADMVVRIDVYTNVTNDKDKGLIRQDFPLYAFYGLLEQIKTALHGNTVLGIESMKPDQRFSLDATDFTWAGGKRSENPMLRNKLFFGRNPEGLYFISLVNFDQSRPKIQFFMELPNKFAFVKNGQPLKNDEASFLSACAFVRTVENNLIARCPSVAFNAYDPNAKGTGAGNSGFGGSNAAEVDFSDDIAF